MYMAAIPHHVAMIPDGNRRWARQKGVSIYEGHKAGLSSFRSLMNHAAERGIQYVSVWGLSVNNITKRSVAEVADLLRIFRAEFMAMAADADIHRNEVRVQVLGRWREMLPSPVTRAIERAQDATANYTRHTMTVFLAYNGTDEMLSAVQAIADEAQAKKIQVTGDLLKSHLLTAGLPPVDLLIRTAGEPHLSAGFMMWDIADAQLYFTEKFWPDFSVKEFDKALADFAARERRLGK